MAAVTPEGIADLVTTTLPDLDRLNWEQIAQELQEYVVMRHWLRNDHVEIEDGITIRKNLMNNTGDSAAFTGITDTDQVDIPTVMAYITVPWRHCQTQWGWHYQTDALMNRGKSMIVKIIQPRRTGALLGKARILEQKAWTLVSPDNDLDPFGVPYWIPYSTDATVGWGSASIIAANPLGGFVGSGLPGTHMSVGGLTDMTNFVPFSAKYAAVSKSDLFPKMRSGHRRTGWRSPIGKAEQESRVQMDRRYYLNDQSCTDFENIGEANNENLGRDLSPFNAGASKDADVYKVEGALTFKGHPLIYTPQLDDSATTAAAGTSAPIYQIDHSCFKTYCLAGDYMRESAPEKVPNQHNMWRVFVDDTLNFVCSNRRRQAVFSK